MTVTNHKRTYGCCKYMTKYRKIGTVIGAVIALAVLIAMRSQYGYIAGLKLFGLVFIYLGYWIGGLVDKRKGGDDQGDSP